MNRDELKIILTYLDELRFYEIIDKHQCLTFMHRAISKYGEHFVKCELSNNIDFS